MSDEIERAVEIRNELEVFAGSIQAFINKLNQLIENEITVEQYEEWADEHESDLPQGI